MSARSKPTPDSPSEASALFTSLEAYDGSEAGDRSYRSLVAKDPMPRLINGGNSGRVLAVLGAKECQKMAVHLIDQSKIQIRLSGFTFDSEMITLALRTAAAQGKDVAVFLDSTQVLKGPTKMMAKRCLDLFQKGCKVYLVTEGPGIQHSKTLRVDGKYAIVGSCNWTNSSRSNHEVSVLLELDTCVAASMEVKYEKMLKHSRPFVAEDAEVGEAYRDQRRARSASNQFRTAKAFSIARSRQLSRERLLLGEDKSEPRVVPTTTA